jgi:hypothetical protein
VQARFKKFKINAKNSIMNKIQIEIKIGLDDAPT